MLSRAPVPALRPYVKAVWATEAWPAPAGGIARERVLPTGGVHLVFRVSDHPLRIYDEPHAVEARTIGHAIVGGARSSFYVRDVAEPAASIGAQLRPGVARLLLGVPAGELAERHTQLEDLWGRTASEWRERLVEEGTPERRLALFEALLLSRLPRMRGLHPAVAEALERFEANASVAEAARESRYSHRRFIALFREDVGLAPKVYCRVARFQRLLARASLAPRLPWAALALDAGYSDQSHFNREFQRFAGLTPNLYRASGPVSANHVPQR